MVIPFGNRQPGPKILVLWAFLIMMSAMPGWGCMMRLEDPKLAPGTAVSVVHVIDFGIHSALIVPLPDGGAREYGYGEWEWYALGQETFFQAFGAVFNPSEGAISRRDISPAEASRVETLCGPYLTDAIHPLRVSAAKVDALITRLELERAERIDQEHIREGVSYVPNKRQYWGGHTCNEHIAEWLEELVVKVSGSRSFSRFEIVPRPEITPLK